MSGAKPQENVPEGVIEGQQFWVDFAIVDMGEFQWVRHQIPQHALSLKLFVQASARARISFFTARPMSLVNSFIWMVCSILAVVFLFAIHCIHRFLSATSWPWLGCGTYGAQSGELPHP